MHEPWRQILSAIALLALIYYAFLLMIFNRRAGYIFGQTVKFIFKGIITIILAILRGIFHAIAGIFDAIIHRTDRTNRYGQW